jgi:phosphotransferase system  glucose/maltose/N-acetylglucosamine-specific IIC component
MVGLLVIVWAIGGVLYGLGLPGALHIPFLVSVGYAILSNYAVSLAIGLAIGIAEQQQGAAALAAFLGYEVIVQGATAIQPHLNVGDKSSLVLVAGIVSGVLAGVLYNRFHRAVWQLHRFDERGNMEYFADCSVECLPR